MNLRRERGNWSTGRLNISPKLREVREEGRESKLLLNLLFVAKLREIRGGRESIGWLKELPRDR